MGKALVMLLVAIGVLQGHCGWAQDATRGPQPTLTEGNLDAYLKEHLAAVRSRLAAAKRGRVHKDAASNVVYNERSKRFLFRSVVDRDAEIGRIEAELAAPTMPIIWTHRPTIGQIGTLQQGLTTYTIVQVSDETTALIDAESRVLGGGTPSQWSFLLVSPLVRDLHEGQRLKQIPGTFKVTGKKTYTTVLGAARTVDVLEPFDLTPVIAKMRNDE